MVRAEVLEPEHEMTLPQGGRAPVAPIGDPLAGKVGARAGRAEAAAGLARRGVCWLLDYPALNAVRQRFNGKRWNEKFGLMVGNTGIGLGALWAGDVDLAVRP